MIEPRVLVVAAIAGHFAIFGPAPAIADGVKFSKDAQLIYDSVKARYDINKVCRSRESLRAAMTDVVERLIRQKKLPKDPERQAREAGEYIAFNCGNLT